MVEPYKVKDDADWITDTSGKAAIWLCKRNGKSFLDVHKGSGFVRARIGEMWVYSCYLAPSLSTTDFSHELDFNALAEERGSPSSNTRGQTLLNAFATLEVALLNEGTQETFNRAGAGSIIDLTFVSSALARRSLWRIGDFFTASDHEAILCTVGTRPGPGTRNRAVKGYRQETLNAVKTLPPPEKIVIPKLKKTCPDDCEGPLCSAHCKYPCSQHRCPTKEVTTCAASTGAPP